MLRTYSGRKLFSKIIKKLEKSSDTVFWACHVKYNPELRFDYESDTWKGVRHLENLLWLDDNLSGFKSWNRDMLVEQLKEVRNHINKSYEKENYLYSMMGY